MSKRDNRTIERNRLRDFTLAGLELWAAGEMTQQRYEALALEHGLLVEQTMHHKCGELCTCWEGGRFPNQCLRFTALATGDRNDPSADRETV